MPGFYPAGGRDAGSGRLRTPQSAARFLLFHT